jgi:hypothetical protein
MKITEVRRNAFAMRLNDPASRVDGVGIKGDSRERRSVIQTLC